MGESDDFLRITQQATVEDIVKLTVALTQSSIPHELEPILMYF